MIEILIALVLVGMLLLLAAATMLSSWTSLLGVGLGLAVLGLALGVPLGAAYHLRLRRALLRCGRLHSRWWVSPTAHHRELDDEGRRHISLPFHLGAAACGLSFLGCIIGLAGLMAAR